MYNATTFIGDNDHYLVGNAKRAAATKDMVPKKEPAAADFAVIKPAEKKPVEKLEKISEANASATPVTKAEEEQAVPAAEKKVRKTRAKKAPKEPEAEKGEQPGSSD